MNSEASLYKLLDDSPYTERDDPLGYDLIAQNLERLILSSKDSTPVTIGVQGGWGVGKSTLMEMLRKRLEEQEPRSTRTMKFNAWAYEGRDITEGLIKTILGSFDDENLVRKTFRRKKAMAALRLGLSLAAGYLGVGKAVDQAWQAFTKDSEMRNQFQDKFEPMVKKWAEKRQQRGLEHLLVVFIDDLDRCSSERVMQVLEAIKLYVGVRNMVFVIGYDRQQVTARIEKGIVKSEWVTGNEYLEKIIQIPFTIPAPSYDQLKTYLRQCLDESGAAPLFEGLEAIIIEGNKRNPRKLKMFINAFVVRDSTCGPDEKMDPACLSRILLMDLYFPQFYRRYYRRDPNSVQMLVDFVDALNAIRDKKGFSELSPDIRAALKKNERDGVSFHDSDDAEGLKRKIIDVFPEHFESFAQDCELVNLVKSLATELGEKATELGKKVEEEAEDVFKKVGKLSEGADDSEQRSFREAFSAKIIERKVKILWVDDHPKNNDWIREKMIPHSVINVIATSTDQAIKQLQETNFDLVISDIARGSDYDAGFDLAEKIRDELQQPVQTIFYTHRVTPSRRSRAEELSAWITSDPYELVHILMAELAPATK